MIKSYDDDDGHYYYDDDDHYDDHDDLKFDRLNCFKSLFNDREV